MAKILSAFEGQQWKDQEREEGIAKEAAEAKERERREQEAQDHKRNREELKQFMKDQAKATSSAIAEIGKATTGRGSCDDDEPPPSKRTRSSGGASGDGDDWQTALRGNRKREQRVKPPMDAADWKGWECSKKEGNKIVKGLMLKISGADLEDMDLSELVDHLVKESKFSKDKWSETYNRLTSEDAKARWNKEDIAAASVAHILD